MSYYEEDCKHQNLDYLAIESLLRCTQIKTTNELQEENFTVLNVTSLKEFNFQTKKNVN